MMKGIAHAAFNVSDMERALRFYRETFGFEKAFELKHPETGEPWIVYVHAGGNQFIELFYGGVPPRNIRIRTSAIPICVWRWRISMRRQNGSKKRERLWIPESGRDATETGSAGPMTRTETGSS